MMSCSHPIRPFITAQEGQLFHDQQPYRYIGMNYWYGMFLAADTSRAAQTRLSQELDQLEAIGVKNLRIMAAAEGPKDAPWRVQPALQNTPGQLDETLLAGLDRLICEAEARKMTLVLVLNNFFHWSGGMAQYVSWADDTAIPYPHDPAHSWDDFQKYSASFYSNPKAKALFRDFIEKLVNRQNPLNELPYHSDPTIMAWQIANEPRGFGNTKDYLQWVQETAEFLQVLTPHQLVSLGGEGKTSDKRADTQFEKIANIAALDYLTAHIWVENWSWYLPQNPGSTYTSAVQKANAYFEEHTTIANRVGKPIVFEEFGISRDLGHFNPHAKTQYRDQYFQHLFDLLMTKYSTGQNVSGMNLWSYSGIGLPENAGNYWTNKQPFTGDPPHEKQGWYSIYSHDTSTLQLIKQYNQIIYALEE
jgi:mannan endo-1,4-beta-mannosidase